MNRGAFFLTVGLFALTLPNAALEAQIAAGTVMVSTGNGRVTTFTQDGTFIGQLDTATAAPETAGSSFDSAGNFYVADFAAQQVTKFDPTGVRIGPFGSGYNADPESILFDRAGNVYVGQADGSHALLKFDPSGTPLATFLPATETRGTDHISLATDQCTMFYTSEGVAVKRFNVCTNTQLADFNAAPLPGSTAFGLKLLPAGGLLVADTEEVVRLDAGGHQIQTYVLPGTTLLFAVSLDPDGTSFWTADLPSGQVFKIDIAAGTILKQWSAVGAPNFVDVSGLSVKGEINVAASALPFSPPRVGLPMVDPATVAVGTRPVVTVSVSISYPDSQPVIPGSVKLFELDEHGRSTMLTTLNDDGADGDGVAGDSIFGGQVQLHAAPIGLIRLQVSAAFSGTVGPVTSPIAIVEVFPPHTPFEHQPVDLSTTNVCTTSTGSAEVCNEILMLFEPGAHFSEVQRAATIVSGVVIGLVSFPWLNSWQVRVPCADDVCVSTAVATLVQAAASGSVPHLLGAEPDFLKHPVQAPVAPNDPEFPLQWGPQQVSLPKAWSFTTGAFPAGRPGLPWIAILDSGIDVTHPDLPVNAKVIVGPNRTTAAGTAARDQTGHGTKVAGVAGAVGNNGVAIAGASWSAVLVAIKVFADDGANMAAYVRGLKDGTALGRKVINFSGAGPDRTETEASAVQFVNRADKVLVAAAGNDNSHDRQYPAGFNEKECFANRANPAQPRCYDAATLSVGATDKNDRRAGFSDYGTWVKVYAPGVCILTTVRADDATAAAGDPCLPPPLLAPPAAARLNFVQGTSFAAPLVSGVAALMNAAKPSAGGALAFGQIPDLADDTGNNDPDRNRIVRLNAFRAVRCAATNVCQ